MTSVNASICAIIPTYNRVAMLKECIDSILTQTRQVQEIIVVNDGSTDDTERVVKSYGNRVTLINKENGGKSSALNLALEQTHADYIWICDDDDIAAPDGVEHLAAALDQDEAIGFSYGTYRCFYHDQKVQDDSGPDCNARAEEPNMAINFLEGMITRQFAMLVRRNLYERLGRFRQDLFRSQDYDMCLRLSRSAKVVYVPHLIFLQRIHQGARGSAKNRFSANERQQRWLEYDKIIFRQVRNEYALEEFTPSFALAWDSTRKTRAALLERACVMAKHLLWEEALVDFQQAIALSPMPASFEEISLAECIMHTAFPWDALDELPDQTGALRACFQTNGYGRSVIYAFCRPLVWQARKFLKSGNGYIALQRLQMLVRIVGMQATLCRLLSSIIR